MIPQMSPLLWSVCVFVIMLVVVMCLLMYYSKNFYNICSVNGFMSSKNLCKWSW